MNMINVFTKFYVFYYYRDQTDIYEKHLRNSNISVLQFTTFCFNKSCPVDFCLLLYIINIFLNSWSNASDFEAGIHA